MDKGLTTATVQYDKETDEYFVVFDEELLRGLGWREGDNIMWIDNKDGTYTLKKEESNE